MFSRGNITEKARVLHMPSVRNTVQDAKAQGAGCAAVDLYAGIGYFTFSYLAAGVAKVLGWDINPWSIEGLRRGALANGWTPRIGGEGDPDPSTDVLVDGAVRLLAFCESNENAGERIRRLRAKLPPIRHINLGLLPTSKGSWRTAVEALDPQLGGWVHVHENFAVDQIEEKTEDVRQVFQRLVAEVDAARSGHETEERNVAVEHVQRVKSYAPGVFHCVIDIYIPPITS
ncbi:S-adenosylmethionine-dependent methyltransferase [Zalaria obscura]|uniref:S-adenosylmethionine-dependent methyltransferase n=1 Tax=Zalaria obscura TaxID=2024903 RepID=A0ACC3SQ92_9PEZI